jgi:hypothetical protein
MPGLPANLTQTEMRERIINERAIELAFEDQRWFDIMRLKIGPKVVAAPMKGMNVVKNANGTFTYNVVTMGTAFQKIFTHVQNFYPIPRREIQKSKGKLIQNPGWE